MRSFGYFRDPLFLGATAAYAVNRWCVRPWTDSPFWTGHFNDLLLIPAALPVVLWLQRRLHLRAGDGAPSWAEMTLHLALWAVVCEGIGPHAFHRGTADVWDVVAYAVGGVLACAWWNRGFRAETVEVS